LDAMTVSALTLVSASANTAFLTLGFSHMQITCC